MSYKLVFTTSSPIGDAALFQDEDSGEFILYYNQNGFLPRLVVSEDLIDIKDFVVGSRVISEANFDKLVAGDEGPVLLADSSLDIELDEDDEEFDDVIED